MERKLKENDMIALYVRAAKTKCTRTVKNYSSREQVRFFFIQRLMHFVIFLLNE